MERRNGKTLWNTRALERIPGKERDENSHATPAPFSGGQHVHAAFRGGSIAAVDFDGKVAWTSHDRKHHSLHGLAAARSSGRATGSSGTNRARSGSAGAIRRNGLGKEDDHRLPPKGASSVDSCHSAVRTGSVVRSDRDGLHSRESRKVRGRLVLEAGCENSINCWYAAPPGRLSGVKVMSRSRRLLSAYIGAVRPGRLCSSCWWSAPTSRGTRRSLKATRGSGNSGPFVSCAGRPGRT